MIKATYLGIGLGVSLASAMLCQPAHAELNIPEGQAQRKPTPITIIPGQISAIHFNNGEKISHLHLSARDKIVYSVNAPTDSGAAQSIFLKAIEPLEFPGEIASSRPNLFVITIDAQGQQTQYEFVIDNGQQQSENQLNIVSPQVTPPQPPTTIKTELGEANLDDIRTGLKHKLSRGEFSAADILALNVAEAIAISLNEEKSLLTVARELEIPLALLSELGRTGLAQKAKYRLKTARKSYTSLSATRRLLIEENSRLLAQRTWPHVVRGKGKGKGLKEQFSFFCPLTFNLSPNPNLGRADLCKSSSIEHEVSTPLGEATLKDIELGISVMQEKGLISEQQARALSKVVQLSKKENKTLEEAAQKYALDDELLSEAGRLGLAFEARQRIFGTVNSVENFLLNQ